MARIFWFGVRAERAEGRGRRTGLGWEEDSRGVEADCAGVRPSGMIHHRDTEDTEKKQKTL